MKNIALTEQQVMLLESMILQAAKTNRDGHITVGRERFKFQDLESIAVKLS